jgi:ABC-type glycerol-3-phosphate transport system permease component
MLVTAIMLASSLFYISKENSIDKSREEFFTTVIAFIISINLLIISVSSLIKSDTNTEPGPIPIYSDGREPEVIDEEWVNAESYNKYLLSSGFVTFIFGIGIGGAGFRVLVESASGCKPNSSSK